MYMSINYARLEMFKLASTALIDKKLLESTKLSLLRKEKLKDRQMEDNTILWSKRQGRQWMGSVRKLFCVCIG